MAGEIKLNDVSVATESGGTVTIAPNNVTFAANHAGIKAALNASGNPGIYACRAWVNFDGQTGSTADNKTIRAHGNVSSVYENSQGTYTINFETAMPDANYAVTQIYKPDNTASNSLTRMLFIDSQSAGSFTVITIAMNGTAQDYPIICFAVFS